MFATDYHGLIRTSETIEFAHFSENVQPFSVITGLFVNFSSSFRLKKRLRRKIPRLGIFLRSLYFFAGRLAANAQKHQTTISQRNSQHSSFLQNFQPNVSLVNSHRFSLSLLFTFVKKKDSSLASQNESLRT